MRRDPVFIVMGGVFSAMAAVFVVVLLGQRDPSCGVGVDYECGRGLVWSTEATMAAIGAAVFALCALAALLFGLKRR